VTRNNSLKSYCGLKINTTDSLQFAVKSKKEKHFRMLVRANVSLKYQLGFFRNRQMKQQKGFTLIELVIVIVILGILAVTAAPRFIDLQSDARRAALEGIMASMQGGAQLVYAKSAIAGIQNTANTTVTVSGNTLDVEYGYPNADLITPTTFQYFVDYDLADMTIVNSSTTDNVVHIRYTSITGDIANNSGCYIQYTNATQGSTPAMTIVSDLC